MSFSLKFAFLKTWKMPFLFFSFWTPLQLHPCPSSIVSHDHLQILPILLHSSALRRAATPLSSINHSFTLCTHFKLDTVRSSISTMFSLPSLQPHPPSSPSWEIPLGPSVHPFLPINFTSAVINNTTGMMLVPTRTHRR